MSTEPKTTAEQIDLNTEMAKGGFTANFIKYKVRQIIYQPEFERDHFEDLEQDLMLYVLERASLFDSEIGHWRSFVSTLVERAVATIVRARRSEGQHRPEEFHSSSQYVEDFDGELVALDTQLTNEDGDRRLDVRSLTDVDRINNSLDVYTVLGILSPEDRELCLRLMTNSVLGIERDTGLTRSTIRFQIRSLRRHFEAHGFSITETLPEES